eukprot:2000117-Amphidinium_carterae.3
MSLSVSNRSQAQDCKKAACDHVYVAEQSFASFAPVQRSPSVSRHNTPAQVGEEPLAGPLLDCSCGSGVFTRRFASDKALPFQRSVTAGAAQKMSRRALWPLHATLQRRLEIDCRHIMQADFGYTCFS